MFDAGQANRTKKLESTVEQQDKDLSEKSNQVLVLLAYVVCCPPLWRVTSFHCALQLGQLYEDLRSARSKLQSVNERADTLRESVASLKPEAQKVLCCPLALLLDPPSPVSSHCAGSGGKGTGTGE